MNAPLHVSNVLSINPRTPRAAHLRVDLPENFLMDMLSISTIQLTATIQWAYHLLHRVIDLPAERALP